MSPVAPMLRSAAGKCYFEQLPSELQIDIVGRLEAKSDISAVTCLSRDLRKKFLDALIEKHLGQRVIAGVDPNIAPVELFLHGAKHDAAFLVEGLAGHLDMRGPVPYLVEGKGTTFIAFALLVDAPHVAACLLRAGGDLDLVDQAGHDINKPGYGIPFPDLTRLCLTLAGAQGSSQRELDSSLRIACSYALPRTVRFLLTRGADANAITAFGAAPIHMAVARRERPVLFEQLRPYTTDRMKFRNGRLELDPGVGLDDHERWLEEMAWQARIFVRDKEGGWEYAESTEWVPDWVCLALGGESTTSLPREPKYDPFTPLEVLWEERVFYTVTALLDFGADAMAPKHAPRAHACNRTCWRSPDCDQRGQTALHLAAAANFPSVVSLLVNRAGANPLAENEDGYTPLYSAIANSSTESALLLFLDHHQQHADDDANPTVGSGLSALHAAARFAFPKMIEVLLTRGANPNAPDARCWTALHELLGNTDIKREKDVVECLGVFWEGPTEVEWHVRPARTCKRKDLDQDRGSAGNAGWRHKGSELPGRPQQCPHHRGMINANTGKEADAVDTPFQMGRTHPLAGVRNLFFRDYDGIEYWSLRISLENDPEKTAEQMRHERLVREGKISDLGWGGEYNANLTGMRGDGGQARMDFPCLAGNGAAGADGVKTSRSVSTNGGSKPENNNSWATVVAGSSREGEKRNMAAPGEAMESGSGSGSAGKKRGGRKQRKPVKWNS
ncbi:hypothetical protein VTK26DRAFT_120 [Humicola hyalothermophila]